TETAHGDVTGIIGITGDAVGSLAISFTNSCICHIVGLMLGETYREPNNEVLDAVGELTNMISGVARTKMEKEGLSVYAAIPSVVYGTNHTINHILKAPSIVIPFKLPAGPFFIDVCIRETKAMERLDMNFDVQNVRTPAKEGSTGSKEGEQRGANVEAEPSPQTGSGVASSGEDRLERMRRRLSELVAVRDTLRRELMEKPFLHPDKRRLYKKNIPILEAKIRRIKLDIAAVEMIEKMAPEQMENPTITAHFQHYTKKS
ncbi:MAG: chemotaxis protein CheX, partial [Syntrophales bacterium]|nr:chemotaxis protein CheX [Syntrophales bacterium]